MKPEPIYQIELSEKALASLDSLPKKQASQILAKIERLEWQETSKNCTRANRFIASAQENIGSCLK
jgi:mRNA-degrading endonuclease RelE of RelBE toxin-antitoxin system